MNLEHFKKLLDKQKVNLEKEINYYTKEDPYLETVRNNEVMDDSITEIEGHDRLAATSDQLKSDLAEVNAALRRIEEGKFGVCTSCGQRIENERLEAVPWAKMCLTCQKNSKEA